jgi:hypothetical protein
MKANVVVMDSRAQLREPPTTNPNLLVEKITEKDGLIDQAIEEWVVDRTLLMHNKTVYQSDLYNLLTNNKLIREAIAMCVVVDRLRGTKVHYVYRINYDTELRTKIVKVFHDIQKKIDESGGRKTAKEACHEWEKGTHARLGKLKSKFTDTQRTLMSAPTKLHALLHQLRGGVNNDMMLEDLQRAIVSDLEEMIKISEDWAASRGHDRPTQAKKYIKKLTHTAASKLVADSVYPLDATAITAEFVELRKIILRMYEKIAGSEFAEVRDFVQKHILDPIDACQGKVNKYSKLSS